VGSLLARAPFSATGKFGLRVLAPKEFLAEIGVMS